MKYSSFGPWATTIHSGRSPQLSTFWKRRLAMLPRLRAGAKPSRGVPLLFAVLGIVLAVLPSLRFAPVSAESQPAGAPAERDDKRKAAEPIRGSNCIVLPMTEVTALQESVLKLPGDELANLRTYVIIDGTAVVKKDGTIDGKALDLGALRKDLAPLADRKNGIVYFSIYFGRSGDAAELLMWAVQGFGRHAGFRTAKVWNHYSNDRFDFAKMIADIDRATKVDGPTDEPALGTDDVKIYPVRTFLSRLRTGNADCVVEILLPFEKDPGGGLPRKMREAVLRHVPKLEIDSKRKLLFIVSSKGDVRPWVDRFVGGESRDLARTLGYQTSSVQY